MARATSESRTGLPGEEWREVAHDTRYEVSNLGRIRRRVLKTTGLPGLASWGSKDDKGYHRFSLPTDKGSRSRLVHHLVLEAFVSPRPPGMFGCHNDGKPANNTVSNLRWDTPKANSADRWRHGTINNAVLPFVHLLGTAPDAEVARLAGVSRQRIQQERESRGVAPMGASESLRWHRARLVEPHAHLLGTMPDGEIARQSGISINTIRAERHARGVAEWVKPSGRGRLAPYVHLLGTMPDTQIAKMAGVAQVGVCLLRQRLGIPACPRKQRAA